MSWSQSALAGIPHFGVFDGVATNMVDPWRGASLQYVIPIFTVLRGKVNQEGETSSDPADNVCPCQTNHIHQHAPRFIVVEGCHDFGSLRQPGKGQLDQIRLPAIGFATQAGITGSVFGIRKQDGMGQSVNGALCQDQASIVPSGMREPQALPASGRKAGEALIVDFVST